MCPVIGIQCDYVQSARYDDTIEVRAWVSAYNGVRLTFAYQVTRAAKCCVVANPAMPSSTRAAQWPPSAACRRCTRS